MPPLRSNLRAILTLGRGVTRGISPLTAGEDPIAMFRTWFDEARDAGIFLPERVAIATATADGAPSVRMMLLKGVDERGFVFYTNYESRKGSELEQNPRAALCFHWPILERQVRVEGGVERITPEESEAYFHTRARGSQLGAWASEQSRELPNREELERNFEEHKVKFRGGEVPLPPFWGGYRIQPDRIEFWQGRLNRLHDRLLYTRSSDGWGIRRLNP
jgi:pyridoxamine 5'-phosphate oxidase